jgi:putative dimethyl sulfoxide reductase chaperone
MCEGLELDSSESFSPEHVPVEELEESHEPELAPTLEEQRKISLSREGLYSFLSRCFLFEVDTEFLTMIEAVQPALELLASSQQGAPLKKASEELATVSSKTAATEGEERKKLLTDLAVEYASLFLGTGKYAGRAHVYPWESAYFTNPPKMYAEQFHQVVDAFKSVGYVKPMDCKEPEDHIALELDFMAHLCRLTLASIDNGKIDFALGYLKLQKEFLKDHLLRWAGKFSERLLQTSFKREADFYHAIATMLESFLALDDQTIDEIDANLKKISGENAESESKTTVSD